MKTHLIIPITIRRRFFLFLLAISMATPPLRADLLVKDGQKVAFLGDSITAFGGWAGGYASLVADGLAVEGVKIKAIGAGVPSNTSNDMLARLDRDVLSKQPDWMTLSCGVNDVGHTPGGVDLETYKKNITSIVDQAQAKGIKVMILTSTVIGEDLSNANNQKLAAYNDFLRQFAKERNLPLADLNPAFQDVIRAAKTPTGEILLLDGIHPNWDGHRIMARVILKSFGVPDGDFPKIEEAWNAIPGAAAVMVKVPFNEGDARITFVEYDLLKKEASARGTTLSALCNAIYLHAIQQTLDAHAQDDSIDKGKLDKLKTEIDQAFAQQIKDVISKSPPPAAPPKPSP